MFDMERLSAEKSPLIEKELGKVLPRHGFDNLNDAVWYHIDTGGKKFRPLLAIMTCESLGGNVDQILPFAAACELFHNWILVHDDIEDNDRMRRDQPTVWVKYGIAHGINVGDYLEHKVFELILHSADHGVDDKKTMKLLNAMTQAAMRTAEGQAMDINLRSNDNPTEKEYLDMVIGKTAHYLTVPMVGAAIIAGREDLIPKLIDFGRHLGPAFQIADDILDLTEGKGRKEIGCDIKEGKRSILAVHCLGRCTEREKVDLIYILNKEKDKTLPDDISYAKELFDKYGSVVYARNLAEGYTKKAKAVADAMPQRLCEILYFFSDYAVQRRK
jgi:geranylgeranyl pyrophosphate synthase